MRDECYACRKMCEPESCEVLSELAGTLYMTKGWMYIRAIRPDESTDRMVIVHIARHLDGREVVLDFSEHQIMSNSTFDKFVRLGFPDRDVLKLKRALRREDVATMKI